MSAAATPQPSTTRHVVLHFPDGSVYRCGHEHPTARDCGPCSRKCYAAADAAGMPKPRLEVVPCFTPNRPGEGLDLQPMPGITPMQARSANGKVGELRSLASKYAGKCKRCGGHYDVGATILWSRATGGIHPECTDAAMGVATEPVTVPAPAVMLCMGCESAPRAPGRMLCAACVALNDEGAVPAVPATPAGTNALALLKAGLDAMGINGAIDTDAIVARVTADVLAQVERRVVYEVKREDGTVVKLDGHQHAEMPRLLRYLSRGCTRIWLGGPAGVGKTTAVEQAARAIGAALFILGPVMDSFEVKGYKDAQSNYVATQVYEWATHKGPAVLLIDEVDGSMAGATLALNAVLANGLAVFPTGQVTIGPDKICIATANTFGGGATLEFAGRQAQDGAFVDRFAQFIDWTLDVKLERAIATGKFGGDDATVDACHRMRAAYKSCGIEETWTPRRTYAVCQCVAAGDTLREAFLNSAFAKLDANQRERLFTAAKVGQ